MYGVVSEILRKEYEALIEADYSHLFEKLIIDDELKKKLNKEIDSRKNNRLDPIGQAWLAWQRVDEMRTAHSDEVKKDLAEIPTMLAAAAEKEILLAGPPTSVVDILKDELK